MIYLDIDLKRYWNDAADIIRLYFYEDKIIEFNKHAIIYNEDMIIIHRVHECGTHRENHVTLTKAGEEKANYILKSEIKGKESPLQYKKYLKRAIKISLYRMLKSFTGKKIPWGSLTGIRPTKLVRDMLNEGIGSEEIHTLLRHQFDVEEEKINLLFQTIENQKSIFQSSSKQDVSLYIGIPFCKSRCLYCSFPSCNTDKQGYLIEPYIKALIQEIKVMVNWIGKKGYSIQSIYIGGGTPTAISSSQLEQILRTINFLSISNGEKEYTVEAGRPDTLDEEKLSLLKKYHVNRISINPQTMNEITLQRIGRSHTPEDILKIYRLARDIGFESVNMDMILGLPGETSSMVENTLYQISILKPENLTVHTLAIKRASKLKADIDFYELPSQKTIEEMLTLSQQWIKKMEMVPYYLYRQKYMMGNLENVGYCIPGKVSFYNVHMMEETQNILALGAGAITKWIYPEENRLERTANVKNVEQYISRIEEMIAKKQNSVLKSR